MSDLRKNIAGPNHVVRVVNGKNIFEVAEKAGLNLQKLREAYQEALDTGDILFITYEEEDE